MTDNSAELMRLSLRVEALHDDNKQLLRLVRDGNGTPALVNKVQALELEGQHGSQRHADIVRQLTELTEGDVENALQFQAINLRLDQLAIDLKNYMDESRRRQDESDKGQIRKSQLVWGMVASIIVSVTAGVTTNKIIKPNPDERPRQHIEQPDRSSSNNR